VCPQDDRCCCNPGHPGNATHACECASIMSGLLRPCLLLLIAEGRGKHGYELGPALEELGLDVSTEGGRLYRALRHLEREGLVESDWDTQTTGPARRVYNITAQGRESLRSTAASIDLALSALGKLACRLKELSEDTTANR